MPESKNANILLVEDNPGDIVLIKDAMAETDIRPTVHNVQNGNDAMRFLRKEPPFEDAVTPDIVILDINLPGKDGKAVLREIKSDPLLALIPVVMFSSSDAPQEVQACYAMHANCYIVKPRDLRGINETVRSIVNFWLRTVQLPP